MKWSIIIALVSIFCVKSLYAQNDLFTVDSNDKGVIWTRMSEAQRDNISNPVEGTLIFNNNTGKFNFYTGWLWLELPLAGSYGTEGPQGPPQTVPGPDGAMGPSGPPGPAGFKCWDANYNRENDMAEDIDMNGVFDINDCRGVQGPQGPQGWAGPNSGAIFSVQVSGAPTCVEFSDFSINNSPNLVLFHQVRQMTVTYFYAPPDTQLSFNTSSGKWQVCALSGALVNETWYDIIVLGSL